MRGIISDIAKILGQRIRNYRNSKGLSQEKLAELSEKTKEEQEHVYRILIEMDKYKNN